MPSSQAFHPPSDSPSAASDSVPEASNHADSAVPSEPGPTDSRIGGAERLAAAMEVVACSGLPTQLLIARLIVDSGWAPAPVDGRPTLPLVAPLLLIDTVVLVAMMVFFTRRRGESVRALWLGTRSTLREALRGLALVPVVFLSVVVLLNLLRVLFPALRSVPVNPMEEMATQGLGAAFLFTLVVIVGGGVREELQRAFMLQRFERFLGGPVLGVIVLSVAFGLGHWNQGYDAVLVTGTLGAFWAVVYLRRRSVVAPMVSHAGFNTIEVLSVALLRT